MKGRYLNTLKDRVDRLSLRERVMVLFAVLVTLFLLCDVLLFTPLKTRRETVETRIREINLQTAALQTEAEATRLRYADDPDRVSRDMIADLRGQIERIDERLASATGELVGPREMPAVLERLLAAQSGLRLLSLENLGAQPLHLDVVDTEAVGEEIGSQYGAIYRHTMRIEFEGSYLDTLSYLRRLEGLERHLFWDDVEIEIISYPTSRVGVTVHTLSLREGWIGV